MLKRLASVAFLGLLLSPAAHAEPPPGYHLVWSDEFDHEGLPDPSKWSFDKSGNRVRWWHDDDQYYPAERLENTRVEDGHLVIETRREALSEQPDWVGQQYSSGAISTRGKAHWTYGFFDIRAKLPCAKGLWPALWLAGPADLAHKAEIDIMEQNGVSGISGTVHSAASLSSEKNGTQLAGHASVPDMCTAFHNYQVEWTPDGITFLLDNQPYYHFDKPEGAGMTEYPFRTPEYLIISQAVDVGGKHNVDDSAIPARMQVEYVRVYQK